MITPEAMAQRLGVTGIAHLLAPELVDEIRDRRLRPLEDDLRVGRHFQLIHVELQRRRMGLANRAIAQAHIDGIGRLKARILDHDAADLRTKYGPGCLHDPDFLDDTIKKNPYMRPNCGPGKVTVRVNGFRDTRAGAGNAAQGDPGRPPVRDSHGATPDAERQAMEQTDAGPRASIVIATR